MTVRQTLLAILAIEPCYGHQLKAEFTRRTGGVWPINVGQIYTTLERLERDGLVHKGTPDAEGRAYFSILPAGRDAVADWLSTPLVRATSARTEMVMKLAVTATLPDVDVLEVIRTQRAASLTALQDATATRDLVGLPATTPEDLAYLLIADSAIEQADAELRWLDLAQTRLTDAISAGLMTALPVSSATPKRGRPASTPASDTTA